MLVAGIFAAIALTLRWLEFSNGAEGLAVATALETRRTGRWLVPTLNDEPRLAKPPLTSWITAAAMRPRTLGELSLPNDSIRRPAFDRLGFEVRWPALLAACVMLYAIFELGRTLIDARAGLIALVVAASSLLWLRFARYATTDIYLAMWVTVANVGLARAIMHRAWWSGCAIAGIALGASILTKGPVGLLQALLPTAIFIGWRAWVARGARDVRIAAILLGGVLVVAIALPWFVLVARQHPMAMSTWFVEVTREGATEQEPDRWYSYFAFFPYMLPWIAFFIAALVLAAQHVLRREADGIVYALTMLVWPILIMALFRDRQIRYLLPMLAPAAVLTAAVVKLWCDAPPRDRVAQLLSAIHWITLAVLAIGFPLAAAGFVKQIRTIDDAPWFALPFAIVIALTSGILIVAGVVFQRRWRGSLVATTLILMLGLQAVFMLGYRDSDRGRSDQRPIADAIVNQYPDAVVYNAHPEQTRPRPDMLIYLSRTVAWTPQPEMIPPSPRPQVLLMFQRRRTAEPTPPPGWQPLIKARRREDWWHAFVRAPHRENG
jgi:4-amino-4-deoxy-L-arabinose transferase-like glycosyltransferase